MTAPALRASSFEGREGDMFRVRPWSPSASPSSPASPPSPPLAVELALTSVTTWGPKMAEGARQPFNLMLHGPLEPFLPQGTYQFDHPALGAFEIFIVPLGPDPGGMRYQAVFA